jgi:hypothetical protein
LFQQGNRRFTYAGLPTDQGHDVEITDGEILKRRAAAAAAASSSVASITDNHNTIHHGHASTTNEPSSVTNRRLSLSATTNANTGTTVRRGSGSGAAAGPGSGRRQSEIERTHTDERTDARQGSVKQELRFIYAFFRVLFLRVFPCHCSV